MSWNDNRLVKWFYSKKLKQKMRYIFLFITFVYLMLFLVMYAFYLRGNMVDYMKKSNKDTMISIGNSLTKEIERISVMSQLIMKNSYVRSYLKAEEGTNHNVARESVGVLYDVNATINNISSIYVIRFDRDFFNVSNSRTNFNNDILLDEQWMEDIKSRSGGYLLKINGGGVFRHFSDRPVISMLRIINDVDTQHPIGILAINFSTEILYNSLSSIEGEDKLLGYYSLDGLALCDDILGEKFPDLDITNGAFGQYDLNVHGHRQIVSHYLIPDTPLILTSIEQVNITKYMSMNIIIGFCAILVVFAGGMVGIGIFVSRAITTPIERLSQAMGDVKSGWLRRVSIELPDDEIGHLKTSYNNMLIEINRLIAKVVEKETLTRQAELEVLQEQIKPHFLYNTLDTIAYLALEKPREEVYDAIETLGSFYRKFLSKGSNEITLQDEVAIVKNYLTLQKLRYDNIIEDIYEVEEALMHYTIPKLILQPLVENSLYHGICLKGENGIIKITAYEEHDYLFIHIYDNGIGMSSQEITQLLQKDNKKSFGFQGTIERIKYFYGREDVYEIFSEEGKYCEVVLKLPIGD